MRAARPRAIDKLDVVPMRSAAAHIPKRFQAVDQTGHARLGPQAEVIRDLLEAGRREGFRHPRLDEDETLSLARCHGVYVSVEVVVVMQRTVWWSVP